MDGRGVWQDRNKGVGRDDGELPEQLQCPQTGARALRHHLDVALVLLKHAFTSSSLHLHHPATLSPFSLPYPSHSTFSTLPFSPYHLNLISFTSPASPLSLLQHFLTNYEKAQADAEFKKAERLKKQKRARNKSIEDGEKDNSEKIETFELAEPTILLMIARVVNQITDFRV